MRFILTILFFVGAAFSANSYIYYQWVASFEQDYSPEIIESFKSKSYLYAFTFLCSFLLFLYNAYALVKKNVKEKGSAEIKEENN